ncbi:hypothetical protein CFC21_059684 [Triticum aestivum]|uniref:MATH domain-containing protein n=2 Tax=Triticum aestivum TaxID=4565 RepID=A0A3B6J037_WHEAT|nr:hypothetical protein CFC21_059684 [Triticum aestivum]
MSAAVPGRPSRSASRIVARPADGFHLLRIDGYSHTKTVLPGQKLSSQPFYVGGHSWRVDYYPNGRDESSNSGAISVYLQLTDPTRSPQQARYKFSLLDRDGVPAYELPAETGSFTGVFPNVHAPYGPAIGDGDGEEPAGPGRGHDEFILKEELERRRGDLIRDDCIMIRCDVGVTQVDFSCLAQDEIVGDDDGAHYAASPVYGPYGPPRRHPRQRQRRRADDDEYVKWCVTREPGGSLRHPVEGDYYE